MFNFMFVSKFNTLINVTVNDSRSAYIVYCDLCHDAKAIILNQTIVLDPTILYTKSYFDKFNKGE